MSLSEEDEDKKRKIAVFHCTSRLPQAVVGLTEGLNGFTSLFSKPGSLRSMQSAGRRHIVIEGEKGIWLGVVRACSPLLCAACPEVCRSRGFPHGRFRVSGLVCGLKVASTAAVKQACVSDEAIRALLREFYDLAFTLHGVCIFLRTSVYAMYADPLHPLPPYLLLTARCSDWWTGTCVLPPCAGRIRAVLGLDPSGNLARRASISTFCAVFRALSRQTEHEKRAAGLIKASQYQ